MKLKDFDHEFSVKMDLQAKVSARNIRYLSVIEKTKGSGYYSPQKRCIEEKCLKLTIGHVGLTKHYVLAWYILYCTNRGVKSQTLYFVHLETTLSHLVPQWTNEKVA